MPTSHSQETTQEKKTVTDVLRARTFFIVDPIVTFLARRGVSPNALTIVGMLGHFLMAWLIAHGYMQLAAVAIIAVAPLDALDGSLARKMGGQANHFGAFLDSTLDRFAEIILFGGFLFYYGRGGGDQLLMVTAYIAISGSLMVSYARARAESLGLSCKIGILSRVERYAVLTVSLLVGRPEIGLIAVATFAYITVAQRIFHVWQQTVKE